MDILANDEEFGQREVKKQKTQNDNPKSVTNISGLP